MFVNPLTPNLPDFLTFLSTNVQIPAAALPSNSPWPGYALDQAIALVSCYSLGVVYSLAVYNCGTHLLFLIAPDQPGQTYFKAARSNNAAQNGQPGGFGLIQPSSGLVASTSDDTNSITLANPDWVKGLTIGQLGMMKTPWGRECLSYLQSYGPTIWGLS